jgi:hypothetical protein
MLAHIGDRACEWQRSSAYELGTPGAGGRSIYRGTLWWSVRYRRGKAVSPRRIFSIKYVLKVLNAIFNYATIGNSNACVRNNWVRVAQLFGEQDEWR